MPLSPQVPPHSFGCRCRVNIPTCVALTQPSFGRRVVAEFPLFDSALLSRYFSLSWFLFLLLRWFQWLPGEGCGESRETEISG